MLKDINITTRESDINVEYGLFSLRPEREMARASLKYIYTDMCDIKRSYFKLGFHLDEFKNNKYYEDFGYASFDEFCIANFDIDKGAISRCINVYLMTNSYNEVRYSCGNMIRGSANTMSEKYKDYSYSQLCEMLPLTDDERKMITPNMSVREIREFKKRKSNKNGSQALVATSQLEPDEDLTPLYSAEDFEKDEFIEIMFSKFKDVLEYLSLDVHDFIRSGKQLSFKDLDDNEYKILFMVKRKKIGE